MKKIILLLGLLLVFTACEKPSECIESTGDIVSRSVSVSAFTKIKVYKGIAVVLEEGPNYEVKITTGANLIDNIEVAQNNNQLVIKDKTTCNWLREYGQTTVYITTPNLEEIYSKSDRDIRSNGTLHFPLLRILSLDKDADGETGAGTGDFYLAIENNQLEIENNNVSRYFLSGTTTNFKLNFYAGDGRIEAANLVAQNINVYHRGSNDWTVKPIQSISGTILSTGNIILKNNPPNIVVQELYLGHLIYN